MGSCCYCTISPACRFSIAGVPDCIRSEDKRKVSSSLVFPLLGRVQQHVRDCVLGGRILQHNIKRVQNCHHYYYLRPLALSCSGGFQVGGPTERADSTRRSDPVWKNPGTETSHSVLFEYSFKAAQRLTLCS
jgi:hypothetical protein